MGSHQRFIVVMVLALSASGCSLTLAPICLARQKKGHVTTITGEAAPGTVIAHVVAYGTSGSQNDLLIDWTGRAARAGPRLGVYLTSVACDRFDPLHATASRQDPCARLGSIGSTASPDARPCVRDGSCRPLADELVQWSAVITHGRGNPEQLGPEAHYKLWIVADPRQSAEYSIDITWFRGPDC